MASWGLTTAFPMTCGQSNRRSSAVIEVRSVGLCRGVESSFPYHLLSHKSHDNVSCPSPSEDVEALHVLSRPEAMAQSLVPLKQDDWTSLNVSHSSESIEQLLDACSAPDES